MCADPSTAYDGSIRLVVETAEQTREVGQRLGRLLAPADLVVLTGELGAGKTTLAQGIGTGMQVRGDVTSPTFVISRVHPSLVGGPALVHVDAYRVQGSAELDDLDLDETVELAVTVVEWGEGLADDLAPSRLTVRLERRTGALDLDRDDEPRVITFRAFGPRWEAVDLARALVAETS